jgi:hypothetical protein
MNLAATPRQYGKKRAHNALFAITQQINAGKLHHYLSQAAFSRLGDSLSVA